MRIIINYNVNYNKLMWIIINYNWHLAFVWQYFISFVFLSKGGWDGFGQHSTLTTLTDKWDDNKEPQVTSSMISFVTGTCLIGFDSFCCTSFISTSSSSVLTEKTTCFTSIELQISRLKKTSAGGEKIDSKKL